MVTKNTLADIIFAERYLEFVSRRGGTRESRARAKILLSTIEMLDARHPSWRVELLKALDDRNLTREIDKMFVLPGVNVDSLFAEFMSLTVGKPDDRTDKADKK